MRVDVERRDVATSRHRDVATSPNIPRFNTGEARVGGHETKQELKKLDLTWGLLRQGWACRPSF